MLHKHNHLHFTEKRHCIGEVLAKSNIFVISTLRQKFNFSVVPGEPQPSTEFMDGLSPVPYHSEHWFSWQYNLDFGLILKYILFLKRAEFILCYYIPNYIIQRYNKYLFIR